MRKEFAVSAKNKFQLDLTKVLTEAIEVQSMTRSVVAWNSNGLFKDKADLEEACRVMGKAPIAVRWVDINKGGSNNPNHRSRLVAKDIRKKGEDTEDLLLELRDKEKSYENESRR